MFNQCKIFAELQNTLKFKTVTFDIANMNTVSDQFTFINHNGTKMTIHYTLTRKYKKKQTKFFKQKSLFRTSNYPTSIVDRYPCTSSPSTKRLNTETSMQKKNQSSILCLSYRQFSCCVYLYLFSFQSRWATHISDAETIRDVTIPAVTTAQVLFKYTLTQSQKLLNKYAAIITFIFTYN